jgi:hypothetical protein
MRPQQAKPRQVSLGELGTKVDGYEVGSSLTAEASINQ